MHTLEAGARERLLTHCDFSKGPYIAVVHARAKLNPGMRKSEEFMLRTILRSAKDIKKYERLVSTMRAKGYNAYGYVSVHARAAKPALRIFLHTLLDKVYDVITLKGERRKSAKKHLTPNRIHKEYITALSQKGCIAGERYFMIDIDTKDPDTYCDCFNKLQSIAEKDKKNYNKDRLCYDTIIVAEYESKNGYHIITKAFNPNLMKMEDVEVKPATCNPMLFLEYIQGATV
ncbi:hypothetical protein HNP86_001774 [Methanococcus maripaludis]|uniref:Uncharacterized protein n=1 Tax=Methanococcus maripaludis TaxID=39152 RepID=A0A7J9NWI0_METMI|nr:hypothetical protein [Methanococcus maripaludis]MBA2851615.1 hypothetical protein [Methanococcus maripaludis]